MGAGAMTVCHSKAAVQVKEDMKKMVQIPILRSRAVAAQHTKLFGASLFELRERGLEEDGVPLVVKRMVEHLTKHALHQEGLFRVNGNVRAVETLKLRLESGDDVDLLSECDSSTVASLIKKFLRDLPGGLVDAAVQQALIQSYRENGSSSDLSILLQKLPDVQHKLLRYLCHFLTLVENNRKDNLMTADNLATVFGPNVFQVAPGFESMKDQYTCNKIMAKLIRDYRSIFEADGDEEAGTGEQSSPITVKSKEAQMTKTPPKRLHEKTLRAAPRTKTVHLKAPGSDECVNTSCMDPLKLRTRKKKVKKGGNKPVDVPQSSSSTGSPHRRSFSIPIVLPLTSQLRSPGSGRMDQAPLLHVESSLSGSSEALSSSQDDDRPISPFYMSNHLHPVRCKPDTTNFLDQTIRSAVEQHVFGANTIADQPQESCDFTTCPSSPRVKPTARQRRRRQREQQEEGLGLQEKNRAGSTRTDNNKENIPSSVGSSSNSLVEDTVGSEVSQGSQSSTSEQIPRSRKSSHSPTTVQLIEHQADHTSRECVSEGPDENHMDTLHKGNYIPLKNGLGFASQALRMKIQESPVTCDTARVGGVEVRGSDPDREKTSCEDVPRLDLTALTEDCWGEPAPAYSLHRESMDREEARLSPHAGGRLIRQLLEEDSSPMVSPRFYAYEQSQQYLDDTEVPPSPPNAHSFVSRRRSSSLGSGDDDREELTSAQLTKRIHILKKKIQRFEERFEEDRKYRPSHSDKVANPEVLRWVNELARLRKELKEQKLMKPEEDLLPVTRQRSNTLPKSFGSQLDRKSQQEKAQKPPVESTLESIEKKLQEKREEVNRPEDIKDMTRDQIGLEKVALQKALLYYESIHGRPVTKSERQVMKPLYDRYRLVKQILCRATTIPVIGSPSSKRRGPLLQPIIEGETALFFDDIKEEEDGSEDDGDTKTQFKMTVESDLSMLSILDHMDEEVDGFVSPVDELKNTTDMRLSNLHSATTQELVEQLQEAREEKKRIRKNLKEFEDQFFRQNGRTAQKEDRSPLAVEYHEYKHIKAKLRLLEVLISKRDATKFI
ncbi:Protein FAM13A [Oryzias melastigma]|uniref:Protein FAM13A n=1 Tax=Oryzias melastigma TaxID=30732 RepID=A0A834F2H1_ORYME|nr:Protein FAM13A [Oryzias melastigma]